MYVCTYICMYVCMYISMYVCIYVCMYVCTYIHTYICMHVRMYVRTYVCIRISMYVIHALNTLITAVTTVVEIQIQCIFYICRTGILMHSQGKYGQESQLFLTSSTQQHINIGLMRYG